MANTFNLTNHAAKLKVPTSQLTVNAVITMLTLANMSQEDKQ